MSAFLDKTGKKYGRLTVIEINKKFTLGNNGKIYWLCECGKRITVISGNLGKGTNSCGCIKVETAREQLRQMLHEPDPNGPLMHIYFRYKTDAYRRGNKVFELTPSETLLLFRNNCYYCNRPPATIAKSQCGVPSMLFNGIDRIDNSKGYTSSNVVSCCKYCNYGKRELSQKDFLDLITAIYNHRINSVSSSNCESKS